MRTMLKAPFRYPETRRENVEENFFGATVKDPYRWLEDSSSPEVEAWTNAQNRLVAAYFEGDPERGEILKELDALYRYDEISLPTVEGERLFYNRKRSESDHKEGVWRKLSGGEEHLLLDPREWNPDGSLTLGYWFPSPDGRKLVAKIHKHNSDEAILRVFDVDSGKTSPHDDIPGARLALPQWTADSRGFYYVALPADQPQNDPAALGKAEIRFHVLGTAFRDDVLIHPATGDPGLWMACRYFGGRKLYVCLYRGHESTVVFARDLESGEVRKVFDEPGATAVLTGFPDRAYVMTNAGAPNYRLLELDADECGKPWREAVSEQQAILTRAVAAGDSLVLCYMQHAKFYLEIRDKKGGLVSAVLPPGQAATIVNITGRPGHPVMYYSVGSFTQPDMCYELPLESREPAVFFRSRRGADLPVMTRMRFFVSHDGTRVPIFILKPIGAQGPVPFVLKAYGGFGVPFYPEFMPEMAAWLNRGGGFAVACIRGGGEYGRAWHLAGRLGNKQNGFDDFYAAAEFLFHEGHTSPDKLGIWGRSNGGLLVAAAVTQRPELFRAAICEVPLTDMLRYKKFGIARIWTSEYGDPDREEDFRWLEAYSPYHNVAAGKSFPSVMIAANAKDDRVDPMHARKMAATLQREVSPDRPVLLYVRKDSGHEGTGRSGAEIERKADYLAFFRRELGLGQPLKTA